MSNRDACAKVCGAFNRRRACKPGMRITISLRTTPQVPDSHMKSFMKGRCGGVCYLVGGIQGHRPGKCRFLLAKISQFLLVE